MNKTLCFIALSFTICACRPDPSADKGGNQPFGQQPQAPDSPAATITKDDKGNSINPEGWTLPSVIAERKDKSTRQEKYQDGTTVKVGVLSYPAKTDREHRTILDGSYRPGGQASVVTRVNELSVRGGRVFCFIYWFSPFENEGRGNEIGVTSAYKFCDMDGDGKYELKGNGLGLPIVPNWAK